ACLICGPHTLIRATYRPDRTWGLEAGYSLNQMPRCLTLGKEEGGMVFSPKWPEQREE
ncbi:hypothetical protein GOODEAATRI_011974, partial [Goodea atripinnis]